MRILVLKPMLFRMTPNKALWSFVLSFGNQKISVVWNIQPLLTKRTRQTLVYVPGITFSSAKTALKAHGYNEHTLQNGASIEL